MTGYVEFYEKGKARPFLVIEASFQPIDGDLVSIKGKTWEVVGRSFSVDYSGAQAAYMRCNVIVKKAEPEVK